MLYCFANGEVSSVFCPVIFMADLCSRIKIVFTRNQKLKSKVVDWRPMDILYINNVSNVFVEEKAVSHRDKLRENYHPTP